MKRYASIDIGTNTVLLAIADISSPGSFHVVSDYQRIPRLGSGVDARKNISEEALCRLSAALSDCLDRCRLHRVDTIVACGTSALRDAENKDTVVERIRDEYGIEVEILSGDQEAEDSYRGVAAEFPLTNELTAVIDIGGGSTELSIGRGSTVHKRYSIDIGCVRLTERFLAIVPPENGMLEHALNHIRTSVSNIAITPPQSLIGVAGTIATLAAIDLGLDTFAIRRISGHDLSFDTISRYKETISGLSIEQIREYPQMAPERADIILAGILILHELMIKLKASKIKAASGGLRYGYMLRRYEEHR